ncbi:MAG: GNAT family N-acetyltransferase [Chloroflexi bacterium]|nr:GNAT family N-acetyltransferase [Chloroflexi bacterium CFX1]MCK6567174.1 GNAT family N-acetyltransferase [Anaerolineales bacterium]MCQ3953989.1 GNAT family N-acetyltransferase [Chloroflexota bacterium]RIK55176.1 MAG: GNAT family N-acetyltransferase [Chloroflexota bacterium]
MDIIIRHAQPDQADALTEIAIAAKRHWNYPERWMQIWLPALTISAEYLSENEAWIAFVNRTPAAWYSLKNADDGLWLDNLWVSPAFIGKGVGRRLFEHALERSRFRGASVLKIEADPNAESFYIRMGARRISEHRSDVDGALRILPVLEIKL